MKKLLPCAALVLAAGACSPKAETPAETPKPAAAPSAKSDPKKGSAPAMNEMKRFDPLTEAKAREILHAQLDGLGADDLSRQTLLYLADLKDPAGLEAAKKLCVVEDGKFPDGASIALEALLVYGEPGAGAKVLELAKERAAEQDAPPPDDYLLHALGRVSGAERAAAVAKLMDVAKAVQDESEGDPDAATAAAIAVEELAHMNAAEAKELFAAAAANKKLGGRERGAAVAGLLRLGDARGQDLGQKLIVEAVPPDAPEPAKPAAGAKAAAADAAPEANDVIAGLGIEGAVEASSMVRKALEAARADPTIAFTESEAAAAWTRIHSAAPAGPELVAWLRDWAKSDETYAEDAQRALFGVGDDSQIDAVASQVKAVVSMWPNPTDSETAVGILDVAARRGLAAKPALRAIVDSAAQISPTKPGKDGIDQNVVALNLAAAHAFLRSLGK